MRIGFDIDGVLADFISAYQQLFVLLTGRDTFEAGDNLAPPTWDWPTLRGYTAEETSSVWKVIRMDSAFWFRLVPTDGLLALAQVFYALEQPSGGHDVYFLTDRAGVCPKRQTEMWLRHWLPYRMAHVAPTVLLTADKGGAARALRLDCYIDDKRQNAVEVAVCSPGTRNYLLNRPYNAGSVPPRVRRVESVREFLVKESEYL